MRQRPRSVARARKRTLAAHMVQLPDDVQSDGLHRESRLSVSLPVALSVPAPAIEASPAVEAPPAKGATTPGRRVLVADDNVDAADAVAMFVETLGAEVRTAYDGLEAMNVAKAFQPEVALLDLGMPLLDGCEVARRIREEAWGKEITLVALTGWGREEDRRRTREAGFDGHLVKPVPFEALERLVTGSQASWRKGSGRP